MHCRQQKLSTGQTVWVRNHANGRPWFPGTISKVLSQQRYRISLEYGRVVDRHIDHVRHRVVSPEVDQPQPSSEPILPELDPPEDSDVLSTDPPAEVAGSPASTLCRSTRDRRPPERLM